MGLIREKVFFAASVRRILRARRNRLDHIQGGFTMSNIFSRHLHSNFSWSNLGNIKEGRGELGETMPVLVYRLLEYALNDVLVKEGGQEYSDEIFRKAGQLAGSEFAKNALDLTVDFDQFVSLLQRTLADLKIGILRFEQFDEQTGEFVLTVAEDLDCSGLPPTDEVVCTYDEGFLSGVLEAYSGKKYLVREIDCWANGDRVCRFNGKAMDT